MAAMGDYVTGGLATLIGGWRPIAWVPGSLIGGQGLVVGFGGAAITLVAKMLDVNNKYKAPEAAQQ